MVGDSWSRDVEGALAGGMQAIWVARGRQRPPSRPQVRTVQTLDVGVFENLWFAPIPG
jgi:FMN phosphatase YigB (HAD superfamily)